jgi:hypothetical protein
LVEVERRRLRALVDADLVTAEELHADDFRTDYSPRRPILEGRVPRSRAVGLIDYLVWDSDQIEVRVHRDAGPRRYWRTDYYERQDRRWHVIWSQATEIDA